MLITPLTFVRFIISILTWISLILLFGIKTIAIIFGIFCIQTIILYIIGSDQ